MGCEGRCEAAIPVLRPMQHPMDDSDDSASKIASKIRPAPPDPKEDSDDDGTATCVVQSLADMGSQAGPMLTSRRSNSVLIRTRLSPAIGEEEEEAEGTVLLGE